MNKFHLEIATPDGVQFSGYAESLLVHASEGDVEILAGHMDYVASLGTGRARIITEGAEKRLAAVSGGMLTVMKGEVKLLAVTFEFAENIDLARAEAAKERAEKKLALAKDAAAIKRAEAKLLRAVNRIRLVDNK